MIMEEKGKVFIVSGPSGAGKSSVISNALDRLGSEFDISRVITYTSRAPREGEADGIDYFFISKEEFRDKMKDDFFLETTEYSGHFYGSPFPPEADIELGKSFVLVLTIDGANNAMKKFRDAVSIWISPPDMTILRNRLEKRGSENKAKIDDRLNEAKKEMDEAHKSRIFEFVLVNDLFEQSIEEFMLLVKNALKKIE
jgi:guanylate kinase